MLVAVLPCRTGWRPCVRVPAAPVCVASPAVMSASAALPSLSELCHICAPLLLLLVAVSLLLFYRSPSTRLLQLIPGPRPLPLIGNLLDLPFGQSDMVRVLRRLCDSGGVTHMHFAHIHHVMTTSPEATEAVLSSKDEIEKGADYDPIRSWLGDGLLTSSGTKWRRRRKLITPAFHFGILGTFLETMNEHASTLTDRLAAGGDRLQEVWPLVSDAALDTIAQTAMGVSVGAQEGRAARYKAAVTSMGHIVHTRSLKPWLRIPAVFRLLGWKRKEEEALAVLHTFTRNVIRERRARLADGEAESSGGGGSEGSGKRKAFLDLLLSSEEGALLTDEDVAEEVDTFMFEGHDTTTSGICWTMLHLARLPDVQQRVHDELDAELPTGDAPSTLDELARLKYLECTIRESLRVTPPVLFLSRTLRQNRTIVGYEVPAGTDVMVLPYMVHRDPRHWPDPEAFDPERHRTETAASRHPYAFVPFSAGPRNCVGQRFALLEMKAFLVAVLRRFRLETDQEFDENMLFVSLTLQRKPPIRVRFVPRQV